MNKTKVGTIVYVMSPDKKERYGTGMIIKLEPLVVEETGETICNDFPTIKLYDGSTLTGLECWWIPI